MSFEANSICIVTPVYNEEEIIVDCVNESYFNAKKYFDKVQYIIVDDGSEDNSLALIQTNFGTDKDFLIISKENGGIGSAFRIGLSKNRMEYIICIPADSPLDEQTSEAFFNPIVDKDVIVGYRQERKGYSIRMKINSSVFHFLISKLFKMDLKDYNWIHLYKSIIFDRIDIESNGLFMLAEILIKARDKQYSFYQIPVKQRKRLTGIATASKISSIFKTLFEMFRFFIKSL